MARVDAQNLEVVHALCNLDLLIELVALSRGNQRPDAKGQQGDVHVKGLVADLIRQRGGLADEGINLLDAL